jgi:hypothetical protein
MLLYACYMQVITSYHYSNFTRGTSPRRPRQPTYDGCHLEFERHITSIDCRQNVTFWFSRPSLTSFNLVRVWDVQVLHDCVLQRAKRKQDGHNNSNMLVKKLSDHMSHITSNLQQHDVPAWCRLQRDEPKFLPPDSFEPYLRARACVA